MNTKFKRPNDAPKNADFLFKKSRYETMLVLIEKVNSLIDSDDFNLYLCGNIDFPAVANILEDKVTKMPVQFVRNKVNVFSNFGSTDDRPVYSFDVTKLINQSVMDDTAEALSKIFTEVSQRGMNAVRYSFDPPLYYNGESQEGDPLFTFIPLLFSKREAAEATKEKHEYVGFELEVI